MTAVRADIVRAFGPLEDLTIAAIESLGASTADVVDAREWLFSSSVERRQHSPRPTVREIVSILQDAEEFSVEAPDESQGASDLV